MNRTKLLKSTFLLILAVILLVLPIIISDPYMMHIVIMVGIFIILTTSLRLTTIPGLWNLSIIAFYGIGSYAVYLLMTRLGLSFWLALLAAGIVAGIIAWGFGYVAIRTKGMYFCLLTIAFVETVRLTITEIPFLGGYKTLMVPPIDPIVIPHLFRVEFVSKASFYYLILILVAITLVVLYRIDKSRIGANLESIADSEPLAQSIGINITRYKVSAFCIGSFFAGIAGGFNASYSGVVAPEGITLWASMMVFIAVIVGGVGSVWGAVIGATILAALPEVFRGAVYYEPSLSSIVVILVVFFLPGGLITLPDWFRERVLKPISAKFK